MKKMIGRMGRNMLLLVLLVTAIGTLFLSCGYDSSINTPDTDEPDSTFNLSGQVISGETGLTGVTIALSGTEQGTAVTDANGNYIFSRLANGNYTLTPALTGFIFDPSSSVRTISGADISAVNFIATPNTLPTFAISGTVTAGTAGLADVIMTLSGANSATTTTDASGNYQFSGQVTGVYTVTPTITNYTFTPLSKNVIVSNVDITDADFTAVPTETVQLVTCPASGASNVAIDDLSFTPSPITVGVNGIVQWTNNGTLTHAVTSGIFPNLDGKFDSPAMVPGVTVCFQFLATGTYPYFCTNHPEISGSVVVE